MNPGLKQKGFPAKLLTVAVLLLVASCDDGGGSSSGGNVPPQEPSWGDAVLIQNDNSRDSMAPQIAMDDTGTAIAVWMQSGTPYTDIWANRFDGMTWETAELIETDDAGFAQHPQIAMDGTGAAIAVWQQSDGTRYNIWANRFDGVSWGTAELIESDNTGHALYPQIVMDGIGAAIAVWQQYDGIRYNIWANRFDGGSWSTAELIETENAGHALSPQIAMDGTGIAIAVWQQNDGTLDNIRANRFDGVSWGTAELIETDDTFDSQGPQIAVGSNGTAIAVWEQYESTFGLPRANIWANRFDGASWGTAGLIETNSTSLANGPQITMDGAGAAIAVWSQQDEPPISIWGNIWTNRFDGVSWGTAERIENFSDRNAGMPRIAMDGTGTAIVVWQQDDNPPASSQVNIWANRFDGSSWSAPELVENDTVNEATGPQIAMDGAGNAIAVWYQGGIILDNIWANRFGF